MSSTRSSEIGLGVLRLAAGEGGEWCMGLTLHRTWARVNFKHGPILPSALQAGSHRK